MENSENLACELVCATPSDKKGEATSPTADSEIKREERHLKYWVIKVLVLTFASLFAAVVATFLYVFAVRGTSVDGGVIGSFLQALTEIIRFMAAPVS